jgi:chloramphenicol-sensitive protein RarD
MTDPVKGAIAMALACTIWGLSPLFYALLSHVPPLEVLAHRTLWSLLIFAASWPCRGGFLRCPRRSTRPGNSGSWRFRRR